MSQEGSAYVQIHDVSSVQNEHATSKLFGRGDGSMNCAAYISVRRVRRPGITAPDFLKKP